VDNSSARPGDSVIGISSSGLHSNGYSLIRRLVDDGRLPLSPELLTPTRLYATVVLDLVRQIRGRDQRIGGLAHITGGGLARNLPRAVGIGLGVRVHPSTWPQPPIFDRVASAAGISASEMRATFNCGVGFAAVVEPAAARAALEFLDAAGFKTWAIGEVLPINELGGATYVEE
jgi:phosphoribosylformylglycinamidine cyclo-ligase